MALSASGAASIGRLKKRTEFQACSRGRRFATAAFVLQMSVSALAGNDVRFGFTATKKTGNAVQRNRMKRRLREVVRLGAHPHAIAGRDYVLVAKAEALQMPFAMLQADLTRALQRLAAHDTPSSLRRPGKGKDGAQHADKA